MLSSVLPLENENVRAEERKALFSGNAFVRARSGGCGCGVVLPVVKLLGASGLATAISPTLRKGRLAQGAFYCYQTSMKVNTQSVTEPEGGEGG